MKNFLLLVTALLIKSALWAQLPIGHHESYIRLNTPLTNKITSSFVDDGMVLISEDKNYVRSYFLNYKRICTLYAIEPKNDSLATEFEKTELKHADPMEDGLWKFFDEEHLLLVRKVCTEGGKSAYFYFEDKERSL